MKLDEAIQNQMDFLELIDPTTQQWLIDSMKLGIEALKRVQKFQRMGSKIHPLRLPGETE